MKKFLSIFLISCTALAVAGPSDFVITQRTTDGLGKSDIIVQHPITSGFLTYDALTALPAFTTIGSGLVMSSGVLSSTVTTGPQGPTGATGATGPQGPKGDIGAQGIQGAPASPFNFSSPATRTIAMTTAYQASDPSKAAIVTLSPSCANATTVLASSACTLQVRQSSTAGLTCANGTVTMTWTSTVQLGLVFSQTSGSPFDVKLPIGGYFVVCSQAGTFALSAVDQSAG